MRTHVLAVASLLALLPAAAPASDFFISEFLADNADTLDDHEGDSEDWIELVNASASMLNLDGYFLTDDATMPNKWALPAVDVNPGAYYLVFASGKDSSFPGGEYHTNFKLANDGEYLALTKNDGSGSFEVVHEFAPYPPQREDISYGSWGSGPTTGYMPTPTPRATNVEGVLGFVGDTSFSVDRGLFTAPFDLEITVDEPDATIRYTTDGSEPTATRGTIYNGPITIAETTVIRAAGFLVDYQPTNIDTQTYIFPDDIPFQDVNHARSLGFPTSSVNGQRYEYTMAEGGVTDSQIVQALGAIPSVSLVIEQRNFSDATIGIYSNPRKRSQDFDPARTNWERPGSFELINEDGSGTGQLQINCGVRIRGGFSRSPNNPKHAFRLFFNNDYEGDLIYPMFQEEGASRFENLDLRTSQNYSWAFQNDSRNTFLREIHGRDAQAQMGQPYTRSRYYHLYINGIYWGLYMSQERAEASYGETYLGGDKDDYDVIKSAGSSGGYTTEATDGTMTGAWRQLWQRTRAIRSSPSNNAAYFAMQGLDVDGVSPHPDPANNPDLLEVDNLADYILAIFYTGNYDAPLSTFLNGASNNWFGMRDSNGADGFRFFVHDGEHSMGTGGNSNNRVGPWSTGGNYLNQIGDFNRSNPQYMHEDLAWNEEYRMDFADRVHKHFFNDGVFTRNTSLRRMSNRFNSIRFAVRSELARWGGNFDYGTWLNARQGIVNFIQNGSTAGSGPGRDAYILNLLRNYNHGGSKPLYPRTDAPVFGTNGGTVPSGFELSMTNPNGTGVIYYTVDGSDPRLPGGAVNSASALVYDDPVVLGASGPVKARVLSTTNEWSALNDFGFVVGNPGTSGNLVISELHYHPDTDPEDTFPNKDDYEFIEFLNISESDTIELTGVQITAGVTFDFTGSNLTQLAPGGRVLVVSNLEAFQERYPDVPVALVAGQYVGNLENGTERVTVLGTDGQVIADFVYGDDLPWPPAPDGDGYSLVLNCETNAPDPGESSSWRSHALRHGNPGGPDGTTFEEWSLAQGVPGVPDVDTDGDGSDDLFEYVHGTDPNDPASKAPIVIDLESFLVDDVFNRYLSLTFQRSLVVGDVMVVPEISTNLVDWSSAEGELVVESAVHQGDGTELLTYRSVLPFTDPGKEQCYLRLRLATK